MVLADPLYCALWRYVEVRYAYRNFDAAVSQDDPRFQVLSNLLDQRTQEIRALFVPFDHKFRADALTFVIDHYDKWVMVGKPPLFHLDVLIINRLSHE